MFTMPGDATVRAGSDCPLRLELGSPMPPLVVGTKVTIPFVVRNVTDHAVKSCVVDGVSVRMRSQPDDRLRLMFVQGSTTDTDCSHRIRLGPNETEDFSREISIQSDFPPGAATLQVMLGMDRFAYGRECGEALELQETVTILP